MQYKFPTPRESADPWEAQLRKGVVEMAALAALIEGPRYGLEIIRLLETRSRLALTEGTIYPILNRIKAEGMVTSEWVEAEAGHPRKYYKLTPVGLERLDRMAQVWTRFCEGIDCLLSPIVKNKEIQP